MLLAAVRFRLLAGRKQQAFCYSRLARPWCAEPSELSSWRKADKPNWIRPCACEARLPPPVRQIRWTAAAQPACKAQRISLARASSRFICAMSGATESHFASVRIQPPFARHHWPADEYGTL